MLRITTTHSCHIIYHWAELSPQRAKLSHNGAKLSGPNSHLGRAVKDSYVHVCKLTPSMIQDQAEGMKDNTISICHYLVYVKWSVYLYYIILAEYQYGTQRLNIKTLLCTAMLQWRLSVDKMERCTCSVMCIRQDMIIFYAHAHQHLSRLWLSYHMHVLLSSQTNISQCTRNWNIHPRFYSPVKLLHPVLYYRIITLDLLSPLFYMIIFWACFILL